MTVFTKMCKRCQTRKPLREFHRHSKTKDGLQAYCKECMLNEQRKWRAKNAKKWANRDPYTGLPYKGEQ